jgi:hypothetical protein
MADSMMEGSITGECNYHHWASISVALSTMVRSGSWESRRSVPQIKQQGYEHSTGLGMAFSQRLHCTPDIYLNGLQNLKLLLSRSPGSAVIGLEDSVLWPANATDLPE